MATGRSLLRFFFVVGLGAGCSNGGKHSTCLPLAQAVGPEGASLSVSAACDSALAGTALLIPPNALSSTVTITIDRGADLAQAGQTSLGASARFTPDGLAFATPATLTLPFRPADQPNGTALAVVAESVEGRTILDGAQLTVDKEAGTVAVDVAHFTDYQVIAASPGNLPDGGNGGDGGSNNGDGGGNNGDGGIDGGKDGGPDGGIDGGIDGGPIDGGGIPDSAVKD